MTTLSNSYNGSGSIHFTVGIMLLCSCAVATLYWTNNANLLIFLFPFLSIVVGGLLYVARPALYLGFTFWIWFVTPFIRRIVDYQLGEFTAVNMIMLTPFLVSAITFFSFLRFGLLLKKRLYLPYLLSMAGVLYGYGIGIINSGLFGATFNLMEWFVPLLVGFHVLVHWREYPEHKRVIKSTFTMGIIVIGFYGILQFISPAPWDVFWMESSGMTSIGHPEPFRVRVFSMLNAPGPFAMILMAGLMLLFDAKGLLPKVAILPGYASFLLATVRGAWGGWVLALLFVISKMTGVMRTRLIGLLIFGVIILIPLQLLSPSDSLERVEDRMGTFNKLEEDGSFRARMHMYQTRAINIIKNPVGEGLGFIGGGSRNEAGATRNLDSGILALFASLGWLGTLLYVSGIVVMVRDIMRGRRWAQDQFVIIVTGVALSYLVLMVMANQVLSIKGIIVWTFLSFSLGARNLYTSYEASQRQTY